MLYCLSKEVLVNTLNETEYSPMHGGTSLFRLLN
jgi:hypothetical protein